MAKAADFAYRQAFALGPWAHEAVFRYADFLKEQNRPADAQTILDTAAQTNSGDKQLRQRAKAAKE